jgi:hypothetical protein
MTKEEYSRQLKDTRWFKKRNKILVRDRFKCTNCKSIGRLEVHHLYYIEGKRAWEYPEDALVTWCSECHDEWHQTHFIVVRKKAFSEGKKRKFKPPIKVKKHKKDKNRRIGIRQIQLVEFQKMIIPIEDRKELQKIIRHMSSGKRREFLDILKIKYTYMANNSIGPVTKVRPTRQQPTQHTGKSKGTVRQQPVPSAGSAPQGSMAGQYPTTNMAPTPGGPMGNYPPGQVVPVSQTLTKGSSTDKQPHPSTATKTTPTKGNVAKRVAKVVRSKNPQI